MSLYLSLFVGPSIRLFFCFFFLPVSAYILPCLLSFLGQEIKAPRQRVFLLSHLNIARHVRLGPGDYPIGMNSVMEVSFML